ncbi:RidA family protein [Leucobacter tardus]|uniref:RidA family protein n=1 Tax=Leucobacter tardus TaxID=501483 RepID=A0A939TM56_9MICO|nr:RidA family protein [Leucobacter tardus]MBO2988829.1 RidA family protein [Leucobacter tardus]
MTAPTTETPEHALERLGLALPPVDDDPHYTNARAAADGQIFISGQLPYRDGVLPMSGRVGAEVSVDDARDLMLQATLNGLAIAAQATGGLDRVRMIQMLAFVNGVDGFAQQSRVADAGSNLLTDVLGDDGRHARTAIGVASLPRNSAVEVQFICEAKR